MKTEQLKVIAIGMDYEAWVNKDTVYVKHAGFQEGFPYKPDTTNNDQMVEIMEKLKANLFWPVLDNDGETTHKASICIKPCEHVYGYSKTINEAVCIAAYEYFKDKP